MAHNASQYNGHTSRLDVTTRSFFKDLDYVKHDVEFAMVGADYQDLRILINGEGSIVGGEDLFALREFLAEFPEEAFVRPADPVEHWIDGDIVEYRDGHKSTYAMVGGTWNRIYTDSALPLGPCHDSDKITRAAELNGSYYRTVRRNGKNL